MRQLGSFLTAGGEFHIYDPTELAIELQSDVLSLMRSSVVADYPVRPSEQIDYYMQNAADVLKNPTQAAVEGNPFLLEKQSFRERRLIAATLDGNLEAVLATDDNISGNAEGMLGQFERDFKRFVGANVIGYRRWVHRRIGQRAINPELYSFRSEPNEFYTFELTIIDAMGLFAVEQARSTREDVRSYPHSGEREWELTLRSWGLQPLVDPETDKPDHREKFVFGKPPIRPVTQTTMRAPSVDVVRKHIYKKDGAERLLTKAHDRLTIHQ